MLWVLNRSYRQGTSNEYSQTSIARTLIARLQGLSRTRLYEILPIAQENKYLGKFSYSIMKLYVVCTH